MSLDSEIKSKEFLKPKFRTKFQTTEFIYKALDIAEIQLQETLDKIELLEIKLKKIDERK